jgi:hypothetical protein
MKMIALIISSALALAACSSKDDATKGTDVSINASGNSGETMTATADGNSGKVAVNIPGFKAEIDMPKIHLDTDDFDMNGAKLYPGSKIDKINIQASKDKGGTDNGTVHLAFAAPADVATVKAWFAKELADSGKFTVSQTATGMTGKTAEGDAVSLTLSAAGAGQTTGTIEMSGS